MDTQLKAQPTLLSSLGAFCLFELCVFQTFLDNLRPICSGHGYPTQGAANTSCPRSGRFVCLNSAFLNISQHFTVHLFRPWLPNSTRDIDGGPRRFTEVVLDGQSLPVASLKLVFHKLVRAVVS